jgi:hypothetical protein
LSCMIVTPSSAPPSGPCFSLAEFIRCCCRAQSEFECFRGALGALHQERVFIEFILFGEASLRRTITEFLKHYHHGRNHQGKENMLLFPAPRSRPSRPDSTLKCHERLGGLLKFYEHAA